MPDRRRTALAALAVAIAAGSTAAILIRWSRAPKATQVFYRLLFTTAFVAPVALSRHREAFVRVSRRDLAVSAVTGVALGAHFLLFFRSLNWTTVAAATTLTQVHAAIVPLGAYALLEERVTRRMVVGLGVAFGGVVLLATGGLVVSSLLAGQRPMYGNALALLAAVGFAAYTLAGRSVRQRFHLFPYVTVVYGMAAAAVGAFAVARDIALVAAFPAREWLLFLGLAVGPGLLSHTLLNWALEHVDSSVASASFLGIPVVSSLLAAALLGEVPGLPTVAGGAVVLCGVYLAATGAPRGEGNG